MWQRKEGGRDGGGGSGLNKFVWPLSAWSGRIRAVCQRSVLPGRPKAVLESGVPMLLSGWHRTCHCSFESGISHVGNFSGWSRKFEWSPWRARGGAPCLRCLLPCSGMLLQRNAALLSSSCFSRPFYCHVEQFTFRDVMVSISECSLVEVVDWRNVVLLELSYVVEGEA